jgi:outer membrane protein assembly factor BamE (lipoprotein component of BamABCDE complex)
VVLKKQLNKNLYFTAVCDRNFEMIMNRRNYIKLVFVLLLLFLMLWGCAVGQGQKTAKDDCIAATLEAGKTTKEDTLKILGAPGQTIKMESNQEIWIYNYTQISGLHLPFADNEMENSTLYVSFSGDRVEKTFRCVNKTGL